MPLDPHTPVLVDGGQVNRRAGEPEREPVTLVTGAAHAAAGRGAGEIAAPSPTMREDGSAR